MKMGQRFGSFLLLAGNMPDAEVTEQHQSDHIQRQRNQQQHALQRHHLLRRDLFVQFLLKRGKFDLLREQGVFFLLNRLVQRRDLRLNLCQFRFIRFPQLLKVCCRFSRIVQLRFHFI